jgi:PadR family transcriptional regulator
MDLDLSEIPQSTIDLVVIGPLHRRAVGRRVEQMSGQRLQLNEGAVYAVLMRLKQKGWIAGRESAFENARVRFYSITPAGRRQLVRETDSWERTVAVIAFVLQLKPEKLPAAPDDRRPALDAAASVLPIRR